MLQLVNGAVPVEKTLAAWYADHRTQNYGAYVSFVGTIRAEDKIEGLSFDIYEPILKQWFDAWQQKADQAGAYLCMTHSRGDVAVHESSYIAAIFSPKRRVALELIDAFVEDFKANAPIWKYDLKEGIRIYAKDRSTPMEGAGLLG
ncbi:MAG: molybdopterin synthase catalytic subunit [Campylobacterota bacterium]